MSALLIFDWDGTLCDSLERIVQCLQLAARGQGLEPPGERAAREIVGLGLDEAMRVLFPDVDADGRERLREDYSRHFRSLDALPSPLFPRVRETLLELGDAGFILSVATGKSRAGLDRVLKALDMTDFFHSSRCADETASKPDPLMLHALLEEHGLAAHQALMVGDTTYDMAMAHKAGMPRLAVSYGAHALERLLAYEPLAHVDRFADIAPLVLNTDLRLFEGQLP